MTVILSLCALSLRHQIRHVSHLWLPSHTVRILTRSKPYTVSRRTPKLRAGNLTAGPRVLTLPLTTTATVVSFIKEKSCFGPLRVAGALGSNE